MMTPLRSSAITRDHLLLLSHPTPNGRLHLGHIAGPYLKMDVLQRTLRRRGVRVAMMLAVDSYDSYVLLKAQQLGCSPETVVARHAAEIVQDLTAFDIGIDVFIEPLAENWNTAYRQALLESVTALSQTGAIEVRNESFLWSPKSSRFIAGCWLQGLCPGCGSDAGGYSCEVCGLHFRPEEIKEPHARFDEGPLEKVNVRTLFLRVLQVDKLQRHLAEMDLPEPFDRMIRKYLVRSGPSLRVTIPGSWGIPYSVDGEVRQQVIFPGFASLGLLSAYGQAYARSFSVSDPFSSNSDVVTVCSFGIDNTISRVMSCVGGAVEYPGRRPPDHFLLNYFYRLEGKKFSTSRRHAIWTSEIAAVTPLISDALRFYLLETAPELAETDFEVEGFLRTANNLYEQWNSALSEGLRAMSSEQQTEAPPDTLYQALASALDGQQRCLDLGSFRSRDVPDSVYKWMALRSSVPKQSAYWWLKALALIAWPVLPKLSNWLWMVLGCQGMPSESQYLQLSIVRTDLQFQPVDRLTLSQIRGCLPSTLIV